MGFEMKKIAVICFSVLLMQFSVAIGQELDANVEINNEQLPNAARDRLNNFKSQVEDYLNNTKFTEGNWEGDRIKCTFNIFFTGAIDETTYSAQLVVVSQRPVEGSQRNSLMLNVLDNQWAFVYEKNQSMYFNQTDFDPLVSLLNYYAYLIIGFDMDSYYRLGGTDFFSKALNICIKGGGSKFAKGWQLESTSYNRRALIDNLLNARYQQLRQDIFDYHYNGLDIFTANNAAAVNNMVKLVRNLEKVKAQLDARSVFLKVFFDAKAGEIVDYLKGKVDNSVFESLRKIDPPHISKYDEALK